MEGSFSIFIFIMNLILNLAFYDCHFCCMTKSKRQKAWHYYSMGNKVRGHCNCNTLKKERRYFQWKWIFKNWFFLYIKNYWKHISTKTKQNSNTKRMRYQLPQHLWKLNHYQWFALQIYLLTWKIKFHKMNVSN
jgi:hypothetical protein